MDTITVEVFKIYYTFFCSEKLARRTFYYFQTLHSSLSIEPIRFYAGYCKIIRLVCRLKRK